MKALLAITTFAGETACATNARPVSAKVGRAFSLPITLCLVAISIYAAPNPALESARERQDRGELAKLAAEYAAAAEKQPKDAPGYYRDTPGH